MRVLSGDTMLNNARGPGWHTKPTAQGILPAGRRGLAQEATWSKRHRDGWVYGHGSCCVVAHSPGLLGACTDRRQSAHEATRLWWATGHRRGLVETVMMERTADEKALCVALQRQRQMTLVTTPRRHSAHTDNRQPMINVQHLPKNQRLRQERGQTVEPRQGFGKEMFALDGCWMHGGRNHRWLFAAMGVAVQRPQALAEKQGRSPWNIKQDVLGL